MPKPSSRLSACHATPPPCKARSAATFHHRPTSTTRMASSPKRVWRARRLSSARRPSTKSSCRLLGHCPHVTASCWMPISPISRHATRLAFPAVRGPCAAPMAVVASVPQEVSTELAPQERSAALIGSVSANPTVRAENAAPMAAAASVPPVAQTAPVRPAPSATHRGSASAHRIVLAKCVAMTAAAEPVAPMVAVALPAFPVTLQPVNASVFPTALLESSVATTAAAAPAARDAQPIKHARLQGPAAAYPTARGVSVPTMVAAASAAPVQTASFATPSRAYASAHRAAA